MVEGYNLKNIRELLNRGFSEEELRDFCFDYPIFRYSVYDELPQSPGKKRECIRQILDYAEKKGVLDIVLSWAEEENPEQYKAHQPFKEIIVEPAKTVEATIESASVSSFIDLISSQASKWILLLAASPAILGILLFAMNPNYVGRMIFSCSQRGVPAPCSQPYGWFMIFLSLFLTTAAHFGIRKSFASLFSRKWRLLVILIIFLLLILPALFIILIGPSVLIVIETNVSG